jgi:isopentenyl diphosphate isomerase/L-lactate dehydrogenase-like FMN-dependent dehydrogenase
MEAFVQHDKKDRTGSSMLASWADKLFDRSLSWKDVKWLKSITKLPIILKGILNGEDGKHCCSMPSLLPATITVVF